MLKVFYFRLLNLTHNADTFLFVDTRVRRSHRGTDTLTCSDT
jgi:hypothetical protein